MCASIQPTISPEEREFVARVRAGDQDAFRQLVIEHREHAILMITRFLHNRHEAEDVAQDVFLRVHRHIGAFRHDSSLSTWITRIAMNLARNRYWFLERRRRKDHLSLDYVPEGQDSSYLHDTIEYTGLSPDAECSAEEFSENIVHARASLNPAQQGLLQLLIDDDMSYSQIADTLGIEIGTVKSRIGRARQNLKKALEAVQGGVPAAHHPLIGLRRRRFARAYSGPNCTCGRVGNHTGMCSARWITRRHKALQEVAA